MELVSSNAPFMPGHWITNSQVVEAAVVVAVSIEVMRECKGHPTEDDEESIKGFADQLATIRIVDKAMAKMMGINIDREPRPSDER